MSPSAVTEPASTRPDTRERLIRAAVRLFQERGYHGTGTADVLASAQAPRGSLYHHFKAGKAELAAAAAAWLAGEVVREIERLRATGLDAADVTLALARAMAAWLEATRFRQGGLLAALTAGVGAEPTLAAPVAEAYARIEAARVRTLVEDGIDLTAAHALAETVMVEFEGALLLARVRQDPQLLVARMGRAADAIRKARP